MKALEILDNITNLAISYLKFTSEKILNLSNLPEESKKNLRKSKKSPWFNYKLNIKYYIQYYISLNYNFNKDYKMCLIKFITVF